VDIHVDLMTTTNCVALVEDFLTDIMLIKSANTAITTCWYYNRPVQKCNLSDPAER
jgi:hypothetical protein